MAAKFFVPPIRNDEGPLERLERHEGEEWVRKLIATLDKKLADVLTLRAFKECSYDEISKILDLPIGTVKSWLHMARVGLRRKISPSMN